MTAEVTPRCAECGALLDEGATCQARFQALLALEAEVPGGPGREAHFYAVATYGLQHPRSTNFTAAALVGLLDELRRVLAHEAEIDDVLARTRARKAEAGRVTRRGDEPIPVWPVAVWPLTVNDVLRRGALPYRANVERWARSVVDALEGVTLTSEQ